MRNPTRRATLPGLAAAILAPHALRRLAGAPDQPGAWLCAGRRRRRHRPHHRRGAWARLGQPVLVEFETGRGLDARGRAGCPRRPRWAHVMLIGSAYAAAGAMYKSSPIARRGFYRDRPALRVSISYRNALHSRDAQLRRSREACALARYAALVRDKRTGLDAALADRTVRRMAKVKLQHVPYRGGAQALTDVLGKRIDFMLDPPIIFLEHIGRDGCVRSQQRATSGSRDCPMCRQSQSPALAALRFHHGSGCSARSAWPIRPSIG